MCDDYTTIYYDGVAQKNVPGTGNWNTLATTNIPSSTKEVMIKCVNVHGGLNGIKAEILDVGTGKTVSETGKSWQCSTSASGGFKPASIDHGLDAPWKHKAGSGSVIWTSSNKDVTAYCKIGLPPGGYRETANHGPANSGP